MHTPESSKSIDAGAFEHDADRGGNVERGPTGTRALSDPRAELVDEAARDPSAPNS